jgi:hypothetical protein
MAEDAPTLCESRHVLWPTSCLTFSGNFLCLSGRLNHFKNKRRLFLKYISMCSDQLRPLKKLGANSLYNLKMKIFRYFAIIQPASVKVSRLKEGQYWGISSVGRASRWHREGRGFESPILHALGMCCDSYIFVTFRNCTNEMQQVLTLEASTRSDVEQGTHF